MIIEFQTSTRNILETLMLSLTESLGGHVAQGPFKAGADAVYLHTVRLSGPATLEVGHEQVTIAVQAAAPKIQGQALFVEQPLAVMFGRVSGIALALAPALSCRLKLRLRVLTSGNALHIRFDQGQMVPPADIPPDLVEPYGTLATFIEGWLRMTTEVPLAPLALSETVPNVVNSGVAASGDRSFIAIRVEFDQPAATAAGWEAFHNGQIRNRLGLEASSGPHSSSSGGWAHFVERAAVENAVRSFVVNGLADNAEYKLDSPIGTGWSSANGEARVNTNFTFRVPDACKCAFWDVDLVGDYHLGISFQVENENQLTLKGDYGYVITSDLAKDCCVVTLTVAWPFLGKEELGKLKMNRLEWFIGLVQGPIVLGMGLSARFGNRQLSADQLGGDCTTTEPWKFTCRRNFSFGGQTAEYMKLTGLVGQADGLVLLGSQLAFAGANGLPLVRPPAVRGVPTAFTWHLTHATCSSAGPLGLAARTSSPFSFFYGRANVAISNPANETAGLPIVPKLLVHEARIIGDPHRVFGVGKLTGGPDTYNLEVLCAYPPQAYRDAPYPCTVLLQTSAGLATVTVPIPPELNKTEEQARQEAQADFWQTVNQCSAISDPFSQLKIKTFWLVDPPPPWIREKDRRKWALFAEGRDPGFEVHVLDRAENILARAVAPTRGLVEFGFLMQEQELSLHVVRGGTPEAAIDLEHAEPQQQLEALSRRPNSRVRIVQTALTHAATIAAPGTVVQLLSAPTDRGRGLVVVQRDRMSVYDLATPSAPLLTDEISVQGVSGVVRADDGSLITWGPAGLQRLSLDRGRVARHDRLSGAHTSALIRVAPGWATLSADHVEFRDANLAVYQQLELPGRGAPRLFSTRQQAVLVYDSGAASVLPHGAGRWEGAGRVDAGVDWSNSTRVAFAGRDMVFAPDRKGSGGVVVDFETASQPEVVAWYRDTPWFVRALTIGDLTASPENGGVLLYQTREERVL
jgi:hypothetical protein